MRLVKKGHNGFTWFCFGAVGFAVSFLLLYLARRAEGMAQWYTVHIYPVIVGTSGRVCGLLPFSLAELLMYGGAVFVMILLVRLLVRAARRQAGWEAAVKLASGLWAAASLLFLLYTLNCGINYQRDSFSQCEGIKTEAYSVEELRRTCEILTQDVIRFSQEAKRDENGLMALDGTEQKTAVEAMHKLGDTYESMKGCYPKPKALLGSWFLSVQSLTGIYVPFTVEAVYNQDMTAYNIPFTICHELSHLRGFMQEKEANFIAYLACMEAGSPEFGYSGSMLGWINCMNVLYREAPEEWESLRRRLPAGAEADLQANTVFWASYDGTAAEVSEKINDSYLKANGQKEGVASYDRMVDLLVAYYRDR